MVESKPIDLLKEAIKALDLLPSWADGFDVLEKIKEMNIEYESLMKYVSTTVFMAKLKADSRGDDVSEWLRHVPKMVGDAYKSLSEETREKIEELEAGIGGTNAE